jgi:hypothetical protein
VTITNDLEHGLSIGRDFVDAETGASQYTGTATLSDGSRYDWKSTLDAETTQRAIEQAAKPRRVTCFTWQAAAQVQG